MPSRAFLLFGQGVLSLPERGLGPVSMPSRAFLLFGLLPFHPQRRAPAGFNALAGIFAFRTVIGAVGLTR